ncbi:MAG: hypothetical protein ACI8ZF_000265 [Candidatus Midichloriaceae bacterium]|jgi:uncharacterized protein (TIGR00156 family)
MLNKFLFSFFLVCILGIHADAKFINNEKIEKKNYNSFVGEIKSISDLKDGEKVFLKGYVMKQLSDSKYEFKNSTGTIVIDLNKEKYLPFKDFSSKDLVSIYGKVKEKKKKDTKKIKVYRMEILNGCDKKVK